MATEARRARVKYDYKSTDTGAGTQTRVSSLGEKQVLFFFKALSTEPSFQCSVCFKFTIFVQEFETSN